MIGHWCGKSVRGFSVALSAGALVACGPHSYELGKKAGGTGGNGMSGSGMSGKGGKTGVGTGGTDGGEEGGAPGVGLGGSSGAGSSQGGSVIDAGGSQNLGGTGGTGAAGGPGGMGTAGGISLGNPLLQQLGTAPTKLDLLFMVDNSIGMADKQRLLSAALPSLLTRFVACVDDTGTRVGSVAQGSCAPGTRAEFGGLNDIHIGIITSSIGDHGSGDVCSDAQNAANVAMGSTASNYNDLAQLLPSVRSGDFGPSDEDFLSWDTSEPQVLGPDLQAGIVGAGAQGCGYEAQLESWYRFLVDPSPVAGMDHTNVNVRGAVNEVVLQQRAAFLRADSVLAIVMLTDENDCSVNDEDGTQGWLVSYKGGLNAGALWHMPRSTSACSTDPSSACCQPCGAPTVAGCPSNDEDESCSQGLSLPQTEDSMNMRCYRQMQRFGVDLLYPVERYSSAITQATIQPRAGGAEIPNPLFAPGPAGTPGRAAGQVVLAGIVGVPWQDIATQDSWSSGAGLTFLSAEDLANEGRWDVILGNPAAGVDPTDALMIESIDPRPTGSAHPLLGEVSVAGPEETENSNPINGHEHAVLPIRDDLQFACIYPLPEPVPCSDANAITCECTSSDAARKNPLCEGVTSTEDGTQVYGKAYPSVRELQVLKNVGSSAVVTSACPRYPATDEPLDPSAGYAPALNALADRLVRSFADSCLPRPLAISQCAVIEARPSDGSDCDLPGRTVPGGYAEDLAQRVEYQMRTQGYSRADFTLCQIPALEGDALDDCENSAGGGDGAGYCYLDEDQGLGDPALLASCPASMKHRIRFVGDDLPAAGALTYVSCFDGR